MHAREQGPGVMTDAFKARLAEATAILCTVLVALVNLHYAYHWALH
jgi:hypothetical protein